jgi:hypothetical protein
MTEAEAIKKLKKVRLEMIIPVLKEIRDCITDCNLNSIEAGKYITKFIKELKSE